MDTTLMLPKATEAARRSSSTQIPAVRIPNVPSDAEMAAITEHFDRRSEAFHARLDARRARCEAETARPRRVR